MDFHVWLTFTIATFLICFSPGPNMLHMMKSGAHFGMKRTLYSMLGCFLAVSILIGSSIAGIGALLLASPLLFDILRYAGAAYLIYLGIQAWRAPVHLHIDSVTPADLVHNTSIRTIFRNGFLIGISNPKALLFAAAFFPQFINPALPQALQLTVLFVTFTVLEFSCYSIYAFGGRSIAGMLKYASVRKAFNRVTGAMFGLFGALLVAKSA